MEMVKDKYVFFSVKNANECAQCSSCPGQCHHTLKSNVISIEILEMDQSARPYSGKWLVWIIGKILTPFILNKLSIFQLHFTPNDTQIFAKNSF